MWPGRCSISTDKKRRSLASAATIATMTRESSVQPGKALIVYLKADPTCSAQLGTDFQSSALKAIAGYSGYYSVTIPANQNSISVDIDPIADWTPEANRNVGLILVTSSDPLWSRISPAPLYSSPPRATTVQRTIVDVNINVSLTATNATATAGQTTTLPTLTFTRDQAPINSTVYFSFTSSQSAVSLIRTGHTWKS